MTVYRTGSRYQEGGAVVIQNGNFTVYRTKFTNNAGSNGGAIHVYTGNVFVHHSKFIRNRATGVGGAVAACACRQQANITITGSRFSRNTADSKCGAVHFLGIQSVNLISGSTFTNNGKSSTIAGGVACATGVTLSVLDSTFNDNSASYQSGVFLISSHSKVSVLQSTFDHNSATDNGGVFTVEGGSALQVIQNTFTHNSANKGSVFYMDSASLEVNGTHFYGNSARVGTLITACSRSNVSLDFDVSLNFTIVNNYLNCTLYDPLREMSTSVGIVQAISTITPTLTSTVSSMSASSSPIVVRLSSRVDHERRIVTTTVPSAKATSKEMSTAVYISNGVTTTVMPTTINIADTHTPLESSRIVVKMSTVATSGMIELTATPLSAIAPYHTPATLSDMPSFSDSGLIFLTMGKFSTVKRNSTISNNSQVAGPNLGVRVALPILIFFVATGLILMVSLIAIVYARKSKNCKTVNILTDRTNASYTHIPLAEAESDRQWRF